MSRGRKGVFMALRATEDREDTARGVCLSLPRRAAARPEAGPGLFFKGVHHGPRGRSEFPSLGQAEAYPTNPPAFWMSGKLQLAQPGDGPAFAFGPTNAMKLGLRCSSREWHFY